ncbi:FAD-dependent oxidoreductase, partial [Acinetobacter baumannii]|nr:FAD-dependent oxidoreductase [Acinetobacter baumannii]
MKIISKPQLLKDVEYKPSQSLQVGKEWSWLNPKHAKFDATTINGTSVDNPA